MGKAKRLKKLKNVRAVKEHVSKLFGEMPDYIFKEVIEKLEKNEKNSNIRHRNILR